MRNNKIDGGGLVAHGALRKHFSKTAKQSKYVAIVKTRADLDREEQEKAGKVVEMEDTQPEKK